MSAIHVNDKTLHREQHFEPRRIRYMGSSEPMYSIAIGAEGMLIDIDDIGSFIITWDDGRTLEMMPTVDHLEFIDAD